MRYPSVAPRSQSFESHSTSARRVTLFAGFALISGLLVGPGSAHADAVLSASGGYMGFPTAIDVNVEITAQVEVTTMVLEFPVVEVAGDYVLTVPSPDQAYVIGVDLDRGMGFSPAPMVGEAPPPALGGDPSAGDPAVSAWLGTTPLQADFSDLETGPLTVRVRFQRLLRRYQATVAFDTGVKRSPLRPVDTPAPAASVIVHLKTSRSLDRLDLSGPGTVIDQSPLGAIIEAQGALDADMIMHIEYAEITAGIDVRLFTHRTPTADPLGGESGYFLLLVDADDADEASAMARTLSMVIDQSGSMDGAKIEEAKEAARAMLDRLGPDDAFNIIRFNGGVVSFASSPVAATPESIGAARDFIKDIQAGGSTNLDAAIRTGLGNVGAPDTQRFDAMILLSDGVASEGEVSPTVIHDNALQANTADARVFSVSVGNDADHSLMEALARSNRGQHFNLNDAQATADMVRLVAELFDDIRLVRLADMDIGFPALGQHDVLPEEMRDLFSGGQAILVGRYTTPGSGVLSITGNEYGLPFTRDVTVEMPELAEENEFIKYGWATEKVGTLLADMSRGGTFATLRDEIRELGLAYRIQTPYTSFTSGQPAGDTGSGSSPGSGGCGGCSGGGGGGGGGWGLAGAAGPLEVLIVLALLGLVAIRRETSSALRSDA